MVFELHAVAVDDEYNFSRYFSILKIVFMKNIVHLQISFIVLITFSLLLLPMIVARVNNSSYSQILCNDHHYHCLSFYIFSYIHPFQSVVDQCLVQQQTTLNDCCCSFIYWFSFVLNNFNVYFVHFNMEIDTADGSGQKK